jgi:hypothetical protein
MIYPNLFAMSLTGLVACALTVALILIYCDLDKVTAWPNTHPALQMLSAFAACSVASFGIAVICWAWGI